MEENIRSPGHWLYSPSPRFDRILNKPHPCPDCKCFSNRFQPLKLTSIQSCPFYTVPSLGLPTKPFVRLVAVKGENVQRDKIILSRSISPYSKRITITYQSPNNRNCQRPNPEKNSIKSNFIKTISESKCADVVRPKILDKKKMKEKQKNILVSFKSVKSASTDLFLESPMGHKGKWGSKQQGSTDETRSIKSLSRVSIDDKFFQL